MATDTQTKKTFKLKVNYHGYIDADGCVDGYGNQNHLRRQLREQEKLCSTAIHEALMEVGLEGDVIVAFELGPGKSSLTFDVENLQNCLEDLHPADYPDAKSFAAAKMERMEQMKNAVIKVREAAEANIKKRGKSWGIAYTLLPLWWERSA
jgi:hypothetical protein